MASNAWVQVDYRGRPLANALICAENFFDVTQFTEPSWSPTGGNTVSAEEAATGNEAALVGAWRRSGMQYWTPTTTNSATWIQVLTNPMRAANFIAIDRESNLHGVGVQLNIGHQSTFPTSGGEELFSVTIPSTSTVGHVDDPTGVVTDEGVWIKRFPTVAARGWRLEIDAISTGIQLPQITGLWLGLALEVRPFDEPWSDQMTDLQAQEMFSSLGQTGVSRAQSYRAQNFGLRVRNIAEVGFASFTLEHLFADNYPMWLIPDLNASNKARLVKRNGPVGFRYDESWPNLPRGDFGYREYQPWVR